MLRKFKRFGVSEKNETSFTSSEQEELRFFFVLPDTCDGDINKAEDNLKAAYSSYCQHWDKVFDKTSIISESKVLKLTKNDMNKNEIFVFPEFDGKAFDHMEITGAQILGTRCILDCLTNNIPIPISPTPVFTVAMRGLVMSISGPIGELRDEIKRLIGYMGGICYDELNTACTHLVASNVTSEKYEIAVKRKLKIMFYGWVFDVWTASSKMNCNADDKEFDKNMLPIFYKLQITSTGLTAKARENVKTLIIANGGTYEGAFSSDRTKILILGKTAVNSPKFISACKYKKDCLTPQWVFDSVKQGYALGFEPYRVSALRVSTPTKEFMQASSSDFNPNSTQLSDISHAESLRSITIDETTNNSRMSSSVASVPTTRSSTTVTSKTKSSDSRQSEPSYKASLAKINMSLAKKIGGFLDGCKVYLSGFNSESKDKLIKVLNLGGAIRYDDLNDQITHVIVGKQVPSDMLILEAKKLHPTLLTLEWIVESLRIGEPAATENFLFKETTKESDEPEHPSPASKKAILSMNHSFKRPVAPPKFNLGTTSKGNAQPIAKDIVKLSKARPSTSKQHDNMENHLVNQYLNQSDGVTGPKKRLEPAVDTDDLLDLDYFANKTVFLFGFSGETLDSLILDCELAQASIVDNHYKGEVDYVISPVILPNKPIPVKYKQIVSESFIETSIQANKCPEKLEYFHYPIKYSDDDPKPLKGDIVSFSVYAGSERIYVSNMAAILGAKEEEKFYKKKYPILIVPKPEGGKYDAAMKWGLSTVTAKWLLKCFETKTRVPLEPYDVNIKPAIQEEDDNTTLKDGTNNKSDESKTLLNPAVIPSSTADDIDLYNTSAKVAETHTSKAVRDFLDDYDKFSQNLIRDCNPAEENKEDFIIKHRRLSELKKDTTRKRVQSPDPANSSNISGNVNDLELDTPAKTLVKKVLREESAKVTPNTKRLKQCIETPTGLRDPETPDIPKCIELPDESYASHPDDTPNTRFANKRKLDVLESYYMPAKERRKSTPFSEIQQKFWQNTSVDDYVEQTGDSQVSSSQVENVIPSPNPSFTSSECQTPILTGGMQKVLKHYTSKSLTPVASTSKMSVKKPDPVSIIDSPAVLEDDGLSKVANFIKTRVMNGKKKSGADSSTKIPQKRMLEIPVPLCQVNSEMLNADLEDMDVGWKERRPKRRNSKKFMFTAMPDENKLRYMKMVEQLGAECLSTTAGFDNACTHLVFERPNRGEKVMAAVAAGRWCLVPKYLEDSLAAGNFLNEEDYEWGNSETIHNPTGISEQIDQNIARSCHNWRLKTATPNWSGAFKRFRVILHVAKRDAFKRIIVAGGGCVLDISEPYYNNQTALRATHCFVDGKSCSLSEKDAIALKQAGVQVLTINYIHAYLINENVNVEKFSSSLKSPSGSF